MRTLTLTIFLVATCTLALAQTVIEGTIRDEKGSPVATASVQLLRENGSPAQTAPTAADGSFHFNAVEAGSYTLRIDAAGFYTVEHSFLLRPRQPFTLAIDLHR